MSFQSIFDEFKASSSGTNSFLVLKKQCELELLEGQSFKEKSSLYFIYNFSKTYVLLYEDEPVTVDFSEKTKKQLIEYMDILSIAINTDDDIEILNAINKVSYLYMKSSRIF